MYKTYSFKYFYELLVIFVLLVILDQATKILIAKIMLNNKHRYQILLLNIEVY